MASTSINNGRLQPLQGFDTFVYFQDQGTGQLIPFGEFTGFQYTIRNATEPYITLGNRTYNYLDGEYQIGWVAEGGKINIDAIPAAIGFEYIGPLVRLGRSPRFQIVVEYTAKELEGRTKQLLPSGTTPTAPIPGVSINERASVGRYIFTQCKIDVITSGAMAGRPIIADRIEGLAEGWGYDKTSTNVVTTQFTQTLDAGTIVDGVAGLPLSGSGSLSEVSSIPGWAQGFANVNEILEGQA